MERRLRRRRFVDSDAQKRILESEELLQELSSTVKLEKVLGLTVNSGASLSCDPVNGVIAYPAGCTVVLYNAKKDKQSHIINSSKKTITCLSFSPDGRYLATGEQGHEPAVRVWDTQEKTQVAAFLGHKHAIKCVAFSPNMKYLISIGNEFDMNINVWNWRANSKVASNKVSSKVKAVSFSENGSFFVTAGIRHVKFWYLEGKKASPKYQDTVPLSGRSAILAEQRNNSFCDIACGRGAAADKTYCITQSGLLCEFDSKRMLKRWTQLNVSSAYCLTVGPQQIYIGCSDATVRVFQLDTLQYLTTLPKCHYLGVDVSAGVSANHLIQKSDGAKYPDAIALCYDEKNKCVSCVYSDHSLYQWDVTDFNRIGKVSSSLYHSACIWGIQMYPNVAVDESGSSRVPCLPPGSFITCSSDDTIRVWNLDPSLPSPTANVSPDTVMSSLSPLNRRNIYSHELLKVFYADKDLQYICDATHTSGQGDQTGTQYDGKNGVRSVVVSPDGRHLASGDRTGTLRVFDLTTMNCIVESDAHDSEVLCLEYSMPEYGPTLLVSASRDRLIHIFDVNSRYEFVSTVDDHSSSITAVKFAAYDNNMYMLSCGADKSLIFRQVTRNPDVTFTRVNHVVGKTTLYDMDVDPNQEWVYTACNDRQIRVYNLRTGKHQRSFKGSLSDDGTLIKLNFDDSGLYAASSCSDKQVYIVQASTGDCVATMSGHSEFVTGLRFSHDCRHVITISGDSCIFVWRLSSEMRTNMLNRLSFLRNQSGMPQSHSLLSPTPRDEDTDDTGETGPEDYVPPEASPGLSFNVNELPRWARQHMGNVSGATPAKDTPDLIKPQGKWAQRAAGGSLHLAEDPDSNGSFIRPPSVSDGQDEIFLGPGSLDVIRRKFEEDSQRDSLYAAAVGLRAKLVFPSTIDEVGSNVKVEVDQEEFVSPKVDPVLYIPQDVGRDGSFEVRERADMLKANNTNKLYSRNDTMADSDEEPDINASSSNLSALAAERRNLSHSVEDIDRQEQMLKAAFELDQPEMTSTERSTTPGFLDRNTPLRQSITARFLERTGSDRKASPLANATKPSVGSEAQQYRPANAVTQPPLPPKPTTYVSTYVKPEIVQSSPYGPPPTMERKVNRWAAPIDPFLHPGNTESRPSSSTSTLSGPSTDRSDEIHYGQRMAFHNRERYVPNAIDSPRITPIKLPPQPSTPTGSGGPTWSYKRPPIPNSLKKLEQEADTPVDESLIRRARSLSQLARDKARRKTLPDAYFLAGLDDDGSVSGRRDDELRSRHVSRYDSPTPSSEYSIPQTPRSAGPSTLKNRSYFGAPPSHIGTSASPTFSNASGPQSFGSMAKFRSMSSLGQPASTPTKFSDENPVFKRISDLRTKLKKSTENLALSPCDVERMSREEGPMGPSFSRSKSYGNLSGDNAGRMFSPPATPTDSHYAAAMKAEPPSNLKRTSNLTKSLQNLQALTRGHAPLPDVTQFQAGRDSQGDLRRVSSGGVTDANEAEDRVPLMPEVGSYYDRATSLPRSRHSKSAVQKKANTVRTIKHNSSGYIHADRMSASGDSDSSESVPMPYGSTGNYNYRRNSATSETRYASPRRQVRSYVNAIQGEYGTPAELSPKDRNNNTGLRNDPARGQQPSRLYGPSDSPETTPRRASQNHYAKLMAGSILDASFDGKSPRNYAEGMKHRSDISGLRNDRYGVDKLADSRHSDRESPNKPGSHYEKMSRHCQDSIGEFRTSLDKVIQAYQLVAKDSDLNSKEREALLAALSGELEGAYKRVGQTLHIPVGERSEPEGSHVDETSSNHNLSGRTVVTGGSGGISIPGAGQDPSLLLQNYADMIMNMVQQKMANNNKQ